MYRYFGQRKYWMRINYLQCTNGENGEKIISGIRKLNIFKFDLKNQIHRCRSIQERGWQLHTPSNLLFFMMWWVTIQTIVTFILYRVMDNLRPSQLILALQLMIRQTFNSLKSLFYWWRGRNYGLGKKSLLLSCFYSTREYKS